MDNDIVDISNLQRQVFYGMNDLGKHKAIVAAQKMKNMNSNVDFDVINIRMNYSNALQIADEYDVIVDCTDNLKARYVLNDAAIILNKPLVHASVYKYQGQVSVFSYQDGPSYRCVFPDPDEDIPDSSETLGIYSIIPGIIGLIQANEVLKLITGAGKILSGKLLIYNAFTNEFCSIVVARDESNFKIDELKKLFAN